MFKFLPVFILLLTGLSSWAQPVLPVTPYTFLFMTNRDSASAQAYLQINLLAGGASNAVVNVNGMTNAQQRIVLNTNNVGGVPTITTNGLGALGSNIFNVAYAGPAVSGFLHSNDYQNVIFQTEIDTWAELNAIITDVDLTLQAYTTNAISTYIFVPTMTAAQITNAVGVVAADTLKYFTRGTYIIPTNNTSWMKPGVTNLFYFEPGAVLCIGHASDDTGSTAAPNGIFHDVAGAATLIVGGDGTFINSNKWGFLVAEKNANSKILFKANNTIRANTNGSGASVFYHETGDLTVAVLNDVENYGYDGYWDSAGGGRVNFTAGRLYCGDTMIEYGTDAVNPHYFNIGVIEKRVQVHNHAFGMALSDNVYVKAGIVNLHSNSFIVLIGAGFFPGCLEAHEIICDDNSNKPLFNVGNANFFRIKGAHMRGSGVQDTTFCGDNAVLENCSVELGLSMGGTNSLAGVAGQVHHIVGGLRVINGLISSNLSLVGYNKGQYVTNVNATVSLIENVSHVFVRTLASSGAKSIILTNANRYVRGDSVMIKDSAGTASSGSSNIIVKAATGTIDGVAGATGKTIGTDYGTLLLWTDGTNWWSMATAAAAGGGSGDLVGPSSSTDNALMRFDGATGKLAQNSVGILDDTGNLSIPGTINANGLTSTGGVQVVGSGTTFIRMAGTTTGSTEFQPPASGQTNILIFDLAAPAVGDMVVLQSVTANGPTNTSRFTNITTTGTGGGIRANGGSIGSVNIQTNANAAALKLTNNITFTSVLLIPQSQLTNFTADFQFAERHYLLTNNFHVSAIANNSTDDTDPKYQTIKLENLSGSTQVASVSPSMKRGGTNFVNVPNGAACTVWLRNHGAQLSNTLAIITLYDSP